MGMLKDKLVLLVDDEPSALLTTASGLTSRGFTVKSVGGGEAAMTAVKALKPSVVVSDVVMPGINGFDLFDKMKGDKDGQAIPFVFLTSVDDYYAQKIGRQMGGAAYITKPVDFNELERVLLEKLGE